jgi:alpha-ribazole phosphatase
VKWNKPVKILLVRHGFVGLQEERFLGRTDLPLNKVGIKQAEQLRDRLASENLDVIYTSPLLRASATAEIVASGHKAAVIPSDDLSECNFGEIEGMTFTEIEQQYPALARELRVRKTGAFPGGETLEQLNERVKIFLKRIEKHKPEETVLVVAHGGPLRLIICNLLELGLGHWVQMRVDHASLSIIEMYPGMNILSLLNDTSHLKE